MQHAASRPVDLNALRLVLREVGELELLRITGLSRQTLYRALAGLPIQPGSVALIERALASQANKATP